MVGDVRVVEDKIGHNYDDVMNCLRQDMYSDEVSLMKGNVIV